MYDLYGDAIDRSKVGSLSGMWNLLDSGMNGMSGFGPCVDFEVHTLLQAQHPLSPSCPSHNLSPPRLPVWTFESSNGDSKMTHQRCHHRNPQ